MLQSVVLKPRVLSMLISFMGEIVLNVELKSTFIVDIFKVCED